MVAPRADATFCSRFVTEALQCAQVSGVGEVNSTQVTPSRLYGILRKMPNTMVDTVPARCGRLSV